MDVPVWPPFATLEIENVWELNLNLKLNEEDIWTSIVETAQEIVAREPGLSSYLTVTILKHNDLFESIAVYLAGKLETRYLTTSDLQVMFLQAFEDSRE